MIILIRMLTRRKSLHLEVFREKSGIKSEAEGHVDIAHLGRCYTRENNFWFQFIL